MEGFPKEFVVLDDVLAVAAQLEAYISDVETCPRVPKLVVVNHSGLERSVGPLAPMPSEYCLCLSMFIAMVEPWITQV